MKLGDKITYARKKAGMSQIDLADALGVSRQSVSKWETEEANPDITKLSAIAKALNVSTDWLLSDEDPVDTEDTPVSETKENHYPEWVEHLPGSVAGMAKRYGWIYGVRIAFSGLVTAVFGLFVRIMFYRFIFGNDPASYDPFLAFKMQGWSGFSIFTGFVMGIGLFLMISGIVLAIALKRWGEKQ